MHRYIVSTVLVLLGVTLLAGCGQKGPLTLPPAKPTIVAPATTAPPTTPKAPAVPAPASTAAVPRGSG
ncbi:MAG: LPS translocon maturation chaperone LptM [Rhodanobacteraceae bacterium]